VIKVVILEDEPHFLSELELAVPWEDWGCLVAGKAADGEAGLALVREVRPDLVLTDIRMPGMDGLALIARIREELGGNAPEFVVISGYHDFDYARSALKLGVKNYLLKPLDDEELEATVRRIKTELADRRGRRILEETLDEGGRSALMLFREYGLEAREDPAARYVAGAVSFIHESYQRDLSVEEAAERLGISGGYLSRVFKKETGYTFIDYLMYYRVKRAAELLRSSDLKIYEVADLVGYGDQRYFSQVFRRVVGLTPRQFKDGK
jgi:two-component system response regulator YesN